jgi:CyaY protein
MDDQEFSRRADTSLEALKRSLYEAEGEADFEVEDNSGALHITFDDPPGKFVISPNSPVRQIWISALSTSFKLDWSAAANDFVLAKTGEKLKPLVARLMNEQLGEQAISLR